jgi:hypothetical protein
MKYRIYIDEVGSSDLKATADPVNRYLSLTGVVIDLQHVKDVITPEMEGLKNRFFEQHPDDPVIFHRKELMNKKYPFQALRNPDKEAEFNTAFLDCLKRWSFKVITVVIDKYEHKQRYAVWRFDPYHYAMSIVFERYHLRLKEIGQKGDMMFESRGGKEDTRLKESYRNIFKIGTDYIKPEDIDDTLTSKELKIKPKSANIAGLQLADLLAFPAQRFALKHFNLFNDGRTTFNEKIMEAIADKFFTRNHKIEGYGIKLLP